MQKDGQQSVILGNLVYHHHHQYGDAKDSWRDDKEISFRKSAEERDLDNSSRYAQNVYTNHILANSAGVCLQRLSPVRWK